MIKFIGKQTILLSSLVVSLFWGNYAQAKDNNTINTNVNRTNIENRTENEDINDIPGSFGTPACVNISPKLKNKIDLRFLQSLFNKLSNEDKSELEKDLGFPIPRNHSDFKKKLKNKVDDIVDNEDKTTTFKLKLHYLRNATSIIKVLESISNLEDGNQASNNECILYLTNYGEDTLLFHGKRRFIDHVHRIIAAMDLPRPGVNMEIYGIQVSSNDPNDMAKAMTEVRREISKTQLLIRETYTTMQQLARTVKVESVYQEILEEGLGYDFALDVNRPLSLTDILILLSAADSKDQAVELANHMSKKFQQERFQDYTEALNELDLCPFEGFFRSRGLKLKSDDSENHSNEDQDCEWENDSYKSPNINDPNSLAIRSAILDFALQYADFVERPNQFDPYALQQTSDILNTSLRATINIINRDIENMFMQPTLENIREIVSDFDDVTYAQVGKTTVTGLSGNRSTVTGEVVSNFDITPPLGLIELLQNASTNREQFSNLLPNLLSPLQFYSGNTPQTANNHLGSNNSERVAKNGTNTDSSTSTTSESNPGDSPKVADGGSSGETANNSSNSNSSAPTFLEFPFGSIEPTIGPLPLSSLLGLLAVYEENRSVRQTLGFSGPNLDLTPYVLRNMASAELKFDLKIGDPLLSASEAVDESGKPLINLSRVTQHNVDTTVYVDAVDLFAISTFSTQSSIGGGRGYVPVIGTVWRGVFSDVPVVGSLFSWKKDPQTVYHESLLLTNSYITPTVMGLALKYPTTNGDNSEYDFENRKCRLEEYRKRQRKRHGLISRSINTRSVMEECNSNRLYSPLFPPIDRQK